MNNRALQIDTSFDPHRFIIRPLTADDSDAYRAVRKRILEVGDARYHSASYRRDKTFSTEEKMRAWCTETDEHCVMGTFYDGTLVGIMAAILHKEKQMAEWDSVWLDSRYRKYGIAKLAYKKLEEWTKKHECRYVETFVRADNQRVLGIRKKQGAIHTHTKYGEVWADGSVQDAYFFITDLMRDLSDQAEPQYQAIQHLESTLASLQEDTEEELPSEQKAG